jgi:predicted nucleic acid-binding protein
MTLLLDSNVVIHALEPASPLHKQASSVLKNAPLQGYETHVSELLYAEVLSKPALSDAEAKTLFTKVSTAVSRNLPISQEVLLLSAKLRRSHTGLKTPDAVHLASAILGKCDYLVTDDRRLLAIKTEPIHVISITKAVTL